LRVSRSNQADRRQQIMAQREAERLAAARAARARWAQRRRNESDDPAPPVLVVPANTRRVTELPPQRREAFRAHLRGILDEAEARGVFSRVAPAVTTTPDANEPPAQFAAACAACRGHCCSGGGDHAYLDLDNIRRYVAVSGHSAQDVMQAYVRRLPATSYDGSCVFHAGSGCTLPRDMRSAVCNAFYCHALEQRSNSSEPLPTLIGAADGLRLVRLVTTE
jgi:hypothetical protein